MESGTWYEKVGKIAGKYYLCKANVLFLVKKQHVNYIYPSLLLPALGRAGDLGNHGPLSGSAPIILSEHKLIILS